MGSPPSAGEEEPVMAVAEVHERPVTSPNSVSRRNSLQGKITSLQARGGDSDVRWRRPRISRVARGLVEGQAKVPSLEDQVASTESPARRRESTMPKSEWSMPLRTATGCAKNWGSSKSTMSGPVEQDQSSRIPADVVSELERLRSHENALHNLMHASRTEVGSELHQVQVELQQLRQERDVLKVRVSATSNLITAEEAE